MSGNFRPIVYGLVFTRSLQNAQAGWGTTVSTNTEDHFEAKKRRFFESGGFLILVRVLSFV